MALTTLPADLQSLIGEQLGVRGSQLLRPVASTLNSALRSTPRWKRLQRLEWGALFSLTPDLRQNEEWLTELGVSTLELTAGEEEALRAAWASISNPPPPLSPKERQTLIDRYLPLYREAWSVPLSDEYEGDVSDGHYLFWTDPARTAEEIADLRPGYLESITPTPEFIRGRYRLHVYDHFFNNLQDEYELGTDDRWWWAWHYQPRNLSALALLECSFEDFLRIFAVDGERHLPDVRDDRTGLVERAPGFFPHHDQHSLLEIALRVYVGRSGVHRSGWCCDYRKQRSQNPKSFLLSLLVAQLKQPFHREVQDSALFLPIVAQILSITGYDFNQPYEKPDEWNWRSAPQITYLTALFERFFYPPDLSNGGDKMSDRIRTTQIIIDRAIVQGKLTEWFTGPNTAYSEGRRSAALIVGPWKMQQQAFYTELDAYIQERRLM